MRLKYPRICLPNKAFKKGGVVFGLFQVKLAFVLISLSILAFLVNPKVALGQTAQPNIFFLKSFYLSYPGGYPVTTQVKLSNFTDPDGLGAFIFKVKYDPNFVSITDDNGDGVADSGKVTPGVFLGSTGKQVECSDGFIDPDNTDSTKKLLTFSCVTIGLTPAAPTGGGYLAYINFTTKNRLGNTTLTFSSTELADNTIDVNLVPHTTSGFQLIITKCGDFDRNGSVNLDDIFDVAYRYGATSANPGWNPVYDMDGNGTITLDDIFNTAYQYGPTPCAAFT